MNESPKENKTNESLKENKTNESLKENNNDILKEKVGTTLKNYLELIQTNIFEYDDFLRKKICNYFIIANDNKGTTKNPQDEQNNQNNNISTRTQSNKLTDITLMSVGFQIEDDSDFFNSTVNPQVYDFENIKDQKLKNEFLREFMSRPPMNIPHSAMFFLGWNISLHNFTQISFTQKANKIHYNLGLHKPIFALDCFGNFLIGIGRKLNIFVFALARNWDPVNYSTDIREQQPWVNIATFAIKIWAKKEEIKRNCQIERESNELENEEFTNLAVNESELYFKTKRLMVRFEHENFLSMIEANSTIPKSELHIKYVM